jgi:2'-5' RNA ligase
MQNIRTFIAVEVGNDVRARAADLIKRLKKSEADVRWTLPENMHITLKFLGDIPNVEVPDVCRHVSDAVANIEPFEIEFRGAGAFPNASRPKTIWIGVAPGEGFDQLAALSEAIDERLKDEMGFPRERRRFHPHLTLGRLNSMNAAQDQLGELLLQQADFNAAVAEIDEVLTFASFLDRAGPTYNVMGRAELSDG